MRIPIAALLVSSLALSAAAQNRLVVYPEDTGSSSPFIGRPDWNNHAEGFIEVSRDYFRGVGDQGGICQVEGMFHWGADENIATSETYFVVYRSADSSGALNTTAAGLMLRVGPISTPTRTGVPRQSFEQNDVFATPLQVPCDQTWFQGLEFPANPNWPATDGHSMWRADVDPTTAVGENPRPNYPWDIAWANNFSGSIVARKETYIMGSIVSTPVLQVGGIDPNSCRNGPSACGTANYGLGGLFPGIDGNPRIDGLDLRIKDNTVSISSTVFAFAGLRGSPLPVGVIGGQLHLSPAVLIPVGSAPIGTGIGTIPIAAPGTVPTSAVGMLLFFQGIVVDPGAGTAKFTNLQGTSL